MESFPQRLRKLREERGMLQRELADKLNISRVAVTQYEQGKRFPEWDTLRKIADIFGVSIDYLLGRVDDRNLSLADGTLTAHRFDDPIDDLPEEALRSLQDFIDYLRGKYGKNAK